MRFGLRWLRQHVPGEASARELGERLTAAGLALDGLEVAGDDAILDLDVPTNRPDCLSVRGVAREIAALERSRLADLAPLLDVAETGAPAGASIRLEVRCPELCRRFSLRVIRGVRVGPSPAWLAERLLRAGLRPINNLVDATNYAMLELGQPLHAFDLDRVRGGSLEVRRARPGERLRTLDGVERRLEDWMIVVADAQGAVSLAGVMGGHDTEITERTTQVLLEAAWWDPVTIYRTARALGLQTDASYRFERRADPEAPPDALARCARLMAETAGGAVAPGIVDAYPGRLPLPTVALRAARAAAILGGPFAPAEARAVLEGLGFHVADGGERWRVTVPSFRADVTGEIDLVEEIGRGLGFDRVPAVLPQVAAEERGLPAERARLRELHQLLQSGGYFEAINPSFLSRADEAAFGRAPERAPALANPMSEKGEVLRTSLLPSLLRDAALNAHHGAERIRLYEIARVFRADPGGGPPEERMHLALLATGPAAPPDWRSAAPPPADPFDLKGMLEGTADALGAAPCELIESGPPYLREGAAATWRRDGVEVAWFGDLAPAAAAAFDLVPRAAVAEADLWALAGNPRPRVRYRPLPRHPAVVRDLSLTVPEGRRYAEVEAAVRGAGGSLVEEVFPFDRYRGEGVPAGSVALGVRVRFQHPDRTLLSEEIDALQARIVSALAPLGIGLRT
jgi:phenylalanyl-tRNA synthetase beta chain